MHSLGREPQEAGKKKEDKPRRGDRQTIIYWIRTRRRQGFRG
jgi:hypothetical protein